MNIDQLRDKVKAAEEKVEKCKKTIDRHKAQMEKKAKQLREMGIDPEAADKYSFVRNGSEMNREAYMAAEKGGKDGWKIERCYMNKPDYDKANSYINAVRDTRTNEER